MSPTRAVVIPRLALYCILLASLSQTVCGSEIQNTYIEELLTQEPKRPPLGHIKNPEGRRHAIEVTNIRCRLWQNCITYQDHREDSHQWECSFDDPGLDAKFDGHSNKIIVGVGDKNLSEWLELSGAVSGKTILILSHADLLTDKMIVDTKNVLAIDKYDSTGSIGSIYSRTGAVNHLASPTGTLNTLVVRVHANDNSAPPAIALSEAIFGEEYCLKSQYNRCSYGQLQIQEYVTGTISDVPTAANAPGVIDIYVDANAEGNSYSNIQHLANIALNDALGGSKPGSIFDLVMFCMPPGTGDWLAYTYMSRWDSYYNNNWCKEISAQMHEIGHNLGLHHSGEYTGSDLVREYGDETCMMGFAFVSNGTPAKCFNPAKSWQVGWYADKQIELDVNKDLSTKATSFILNGVVDYQDSSVDRYIVVKIGDFYIGYNRAASFNAGVHEARDQVTIIEKQGGQEASTRSQLASKLSVGGFYSIQVTDIVEVTVTYVSNFNNKDAVIELKSNGPTTGCSSEMQVELTTDSFPRETSWKVVDNAGRSIYSVAEGSLTSTGTYTDDVVGLCRGLQYYFIIEDSYGDGICCDVGTGSYKGIFEGEEIFSSSGEFGRDETKVFSLPLIQPTWSPTSNWTYPPTTYPTPTSTEGPSPTTAPTSFPTRGPSVGPTTAPTSFPTRGPSVGPTTVPTSFPTRGPSVGPTTAPTSFPTRGPSVGPTTAPTSFPTRGPTIDCTDNPTKKFAIEVDGTNKTKDCAWVTSKKKSKRKEYCKMKVELKNGNTKKLSAICKETCGLVGKGPCKHLKSL